MNQPNQATVLLGHNTATVTHVLDEPLRTLIDRDIQDEFNYEVRRLMAENARKFNNDNQQLIDFITATLSYFIQDGYSRLHIKQQVTDMVG